MGFQPETAGEFFKDFASKLLLLDTGIDPDSVKRMAELTRALGAAGNADRGRARPHPPAARPRRARSAPRGTPLAAADGRRTHGIGANWPTMPVGDGSAGQAGQGTQSEADAVAAIENVFRMLFAPASWHYLRVDAEQPLPDAERAGRTAGCNSPPCRYLGLDAVRQWFPAAHRARGTDPGAAGGRWPRLSRISRALPQPGAGDQRRMRPGHRQRAHAHKRLVEAEKMASLGVLVAGVAHEINTPLGVGLAAISTLQQQSGEIADRFAARQMTQSNLQAYLAAATTETALIRANLDRIGKLVDAFRQVAVLGGTPTRRRLSLRTLIGEVVASFETRLVTAGANVDIRCAPALEIDGVHADWTTILSNLIANSLFEPFFTTDLQRNMGLGMHLVYNLVTQRFGGSIWCESRLGEGAEFHIEVPR
jgi:hypothetical protein